MNARPWTRLVVLTLALTCIPGKEEEFRAEPPRDGTLIQIARAGQPTPDGSETFTPRLELLGFNDAGQVAFLSFFSGTTSGYPSSRMYIGSRDTLTEIVRAGQSAPDRNGTFSSLLPQSFDTRCPIGFFSRKTRDEILRLVLPESINSNGQLAFLGTLIGTVGGQSDTTGVFLGASGSVIPIARAGQSVPDGSGAFSSFGIPVVNGKDEVAFQAVILRPGGNQNCTTGVFLWRAASLTQIAEAAGRPAPNGSGLFRGFSPPVINNKGQVAFVGYLPGSIQGQPNSALYVSDGATIIEVARTGQPAPDGNGRLLTFSLPALNDQGEVAFQALLTETKGGQRDMSGVFLATGSGLRQIARSGQPASDGNGTILDFSFPLLNNAGQVVVTATFTGTTGGGSDNTAIFLGTERGGLRQIARAGTRAQDGNGRLASVGRPWINGKGQVVFGTIYIETKAGTGDNSAIFLSDGDTLAEIIRAGQPAPDGNGKFSAIGPPHLNNAGQIAFSATLSGTPRDEYDYTGVYIWSPAQKK